MSVVADGSPTGQQDQVDVCDIPRHEQEEEMYMRMALNVGKAALELGEVPVGCVIVQRLENGDSVVISHGANQVNCTRDATRHAEIVAIDRMLTGGQSSDLLRLPSDVIATSAHGSVPQNSALLSKEQREELYRDKWVNVPDDPSHWKNNYGWGSGRTYPQSVFRNCDLYVTCEPCIMVRTNLAELLRF
jgi:tRNA(Arg) A34 adenosine deaminase TadA